MRTREALPAPELLSTVTPSDAAVFQVTTDPETASHVFYNYHQAFEPTSRFVLFNRTGSDGPALWLCDLADDFALQPVTGAEDALAGGHQGLSFSPDGQWVWYSRLTDSRLEICRRALTGSPAETVFASDRTLPEFGGRRILGARWLSFSHDGKRLLAVIQIEGRERYYSMAILTFDMTRLVPHTAFETGPRNWNNKSQYAPCLGPDGEYLIGVCDCYSQARLDSDGKWHCDPLPEAELGNGSEYLVDEAGTVRYAYPVGRDRPHQNVSHWAWFGKSLAKVFHCDAFDTAPHWRGAILLAEPVPADETTRHLGRHLPGGQQLELTRHITRPDVCHICVADDGSAMVCDTIGFNQGTESYLYTATFERDADGPFIRPRYLLHPKSSWQPYWCETLPCMTPDKRWILFNSDYPGVNGYRGARHTAQVFAVSVDPVR